MARGRERLRRAAAIACAAAAVGCELASAMLFWRDPGLTRPEAWALSSPVIVWVPIALLAALIAWRGVRSRGTSMLALAMAVTALDNGLANLVTALPHLDQPFIVARVIVSFVAAGSYLRATQSFPRLLRPSDLHRPGTPWRRLPALRAALRFFLQPWATWSLALLWVSASLLGAAMLASPLVIALGAAYWHVHYRIGSPKTRRRVIWFAQAALSFLLLMLLARGVGGLLIASGADEYRPYVVIGYNLLAAICACGSFAMAVFGAGAVNPSLVLRATLLYGLAATLLLGLLNGILSVAIDVAVEAFGVSDRLVAAFLGALAGLVVDPLISGLRRLLLASRRAGTPQSGEGALSRPAG